MENNSGNKVRKGVSKVFDGMLNCNFISRVTTVDFKVGMAVSMFVAYIVKAYFSPKFSTESFRNIYIESNMHCHITHIEDVVNKQDSQTLFLSE